MPVYAGNDYALSQPQGPREYVWEPNITEFPDDPFDPKSGIVLKGVFWARGKEFFHVAFAFAIMFLVFFLTTRQYFSYAAVSIAGGEIVAFTDLDRLVFPIVTAILASSGFLIHEFAHRQVGRKYKLPAKFRLLTVGILVTVFGLIMYFYFGFPPFALPGAVVVIGLENRDQAGKCKIAGPLSNCIISFVLVPVFLVFLGVDARLALVLLLGAYVNTFLGVFNMLPVGMLDGRNIISWNRRAYLILMVILVALLAFELYYLTQMRFYIA